MSSHPLIKSLSDIGITVTIQDDRLRLTGNLQELTDEMKAALQREKPAIMAALSDTEVPPARHKKCSDCGHLSGFFCTTTNADRRPASWNGRRGQDPHLTHECAGYRER